MHTQTDNTTVFSVSDEFIGLRVDKFLSEKFPDQTRSYLQKLIDGGYVTIADKPIAKNYKMRKGDVLSIEVPELTVPDIVAQDIPLHIVYEDDDLLVVNKPKGMVVHPAPGNYENTLVNALLFHCGSSLSGINGVVRPGIVHRIDKNTSGLLIVAKNDLAHQSLAAQIKEHSLVREYEAVVYGNVKEDNGRVEAPIGRSKGDRKQMCITNENSRDAITHFEVITRYQGFTHMRFRLETGRTHQIRVHMAYLGHPVAGDEVYGPKKVITKLKGQCLHAKTIGFVHPKTGDWMKFTGELPEYFETFLKGLTIR